MSRTVAMYIGGKSRSTTRRSKQTGGSPFKNWEIRAIDGDDTKICLRAPKYIWNELSIGAWYDMTLEKLRVTTHGSSDWVASAELNGHHKKLKILESIGIIHDIGLIVLEYSFPQTMEFPKEPRLCHTHQKIRST